MSTDVPAAVGEPTVHANGMHKDVQRAGDGLLKLAAAGDERLAVALSRLVEVVAAEAARTPRFARALTKALEVPAPGAAPVRTADDARRGRRRAPGPIDPFAVFAEGGEEGLRDRLSTLTLEQLRDILAEHGMDQDRLAMKWKDNPRVVARIVERVGARAAKGSAFR